MNRRITLTAAALAFLAAASVSFGYGTGGYIVNTKHNFSTASWNTANQQICQPCHTPHHSIAPDVSTKIWNHTLSTAMYIPHSGAVYGNPTDPTKITNLGTGAQLLDNPSRLCMSCHDGTVAVDAFGHKLGSTDRNPGDPANMFGSTDSRNLGTDLSVNHPVGTSAPYGSNTTSFKDLTGTALRLSSVATPISYGHGSTGGTTTSVVGCTTCHNAHGSGDSGSTVAYAFLLRMNNTASALCLTCHVK